MAKPIFILASKSPRRKELLKNIGLDVQIFPANVDESALKDLPPEKMVQQLAMLKASHVAHTFNCEVYVIGADTVVVLDGEVFGKPHNIEEAVGMLSRLSGKTHSVYTGYCVINTKTNTAVSKCEKTEVTFRKLSEKEIMAYVKTREPMDKAGAYGIQEKGSIFIEKINGDYFNVVGLPVCALSKMLAEEFNINIL